MKTVTSFFFFILLTVVSFTSFGQDEAPADSVEYADLDLTPQAFGEDGFVETEMGLSDDLSKLFIDVTDEEYLGEIVFVEHKKGKKHVTFGEMSEVYTEGEARQYTMDAANDRTDIFFKTTYGVTSINIVREGKIFYIVVNGKLIDAWDKDNHYRDLNGKKVDAFKKKVDWVYTAKVEAE